MFRSERMTLCQLYLQNEAAYPCISELGELGLVQFRDVNKEVTVLQRKFINDVRRCDEMERILRFLETEIKKDDIPIFDSGENYIAPPPKEIIDLEATLEKLETELREVNINAYELSKTYLELMELKYILSKSRTFFEEEETTLSPVMDGQETILIPYESTVESIQLGFVAGVIQRNRIPVFERVVWRMCHGNVFFKHEEIEEEFEDLLTGNKTKKSVFIIFFQGERLKVKVKKICEGFQATLYPCPETAEERQAKLEDVMVRLGDLATILNQTEEHRHRHLVNTARNIKSWFVKVRKIKAIYHTLNLFDQDVTRKCLIAECWCAVIDIPKIKKALERGTDISGSTVPSILECIRYNEMPPTFNRTNKFTIGFQNLVNSYGVANYREANPAPYTIITFPFLFAMMFGDAGHGLIMFLFALWMVLQEKSLQKQTLNEMFGMLFSGRYIVLLMGLFSVYTGLIYNDVFSKSLNMFGTSWIPINISESQIKNSVFQLSPQNYTGHPYPFGLDPVWQVAKNKIVFTNSYKMKISIVFGISQMLFGVILSAWNHCYHRNYLNLLCEFLPQIIFLVSIFGYLVGLIFTKWIIAINYAPTYGCAPSLLIMLINMFMFSYPTEPCYLKNIYGAQPYIQMGLVSLAFICVPWMLVIKPFILARRARSGTYRRHEFSSEDESAFDFMDIFVDQVIHTIEYCLGTISHTASYLRLWALSLAHAQLSEVLWNMVMKIALNNSGWMGVIYLYPIFAFWAVLTIGILLIMEGLSAFLHALRLHWIEFQTKFYHGEGNIFSPLSFKTMLESEE